MVKKWGTFPTYSKGWRPALTIIEKRQREMDRLIAKYYVRDPDATQDAIAVDVVKEHLDEDGWAPKTVVTRIQELSQGKVLDKHIEVMKWKDVGYPFRYRIDVHLDVEALRGGG